LFFQFTRLAPVDPYIGFSGFAAVFDIFPQDDWTNTLAAGMNRSGMGKRIYIRRQ